MLRGSLMLKNLIELESLSLLPHPVNNRHSISICGMYEARGDAGAKRRGLGTVGRPGWLVMPWACLSLPTTLSLGRGWVGGWGNEANRWPLPESPPLGQIITPALPSCFHLGLPRPSLDSLDQGNDRGLAGPVDWWWTQPGRVAPGWG